MMLKFSKYTFLVVIPMSICKCRIPFSGWSVFTEVTSSGSFLFESPHCSTFFYQASNLATVTLLNMCVAGLGGIGNVGQGGEVWTEVCVSTWLTSIKIKIIKSWLWPSSWLLFKYFVIAETGRSWHLEQICEIKGKEVLLQTNMSDSRTKEWFIVPFYCVL